VATGQFDRQRTTERQPGHAGLFEAEFDDEPGVAAGVAATLC
jgi:hypothetical protein